MKYNDTPLFCIDNDGKKVLYRDWDKIPTEQLEEFERSIHEERVKRAIAKGKRPETVKHLTTKQILRNKNRNEHRRNNSYNAHFLQPCSPDTYDEYGEEVPADMDHLGKYSADYTSEREIEDWIETISIKQTLTLGGLEPERVDLLIRCEVTKDKKKQDIAKEMGIDPQSLTMQLQRIRKRAKKILRTPLDSTSPAAKEGQEGEDE